MLVSRRVAERCHRTAIPARSGDRVTEDVGHNQRIDRDGSCSAFTRTDARRRSAQIVTSAYASAPHGETLLARMLLVLSAAALPLGWLLRRRSDRRGAQVVEVGCTILFARDLAMIVTGAPARLRPLPRVLLFTELATSSTAVAAGWRSWVCRPVNDSARTKTAGTPATVHTRKLPNDSGVVRVRTIAAAATFVLHTVRQVIYVSAGHGRLRDDARIATEIPKVLGRQRSRADNWLCALDARAVHETARNKIPTAP